MPRSASRPGSNPQTNASHNESNMEQRSRQMKYKCTFSATVSDVFKRRGWVEASEQQDDWDIFFCDMNQMRDLFTSCSRPLEDHQRIGHFRNSFEISRKNFMVRNLKRLKSRIERAFGKEEGKKCQFFPTTFILPLEERIFLQEFRYKPSCFWIIKPAAGAQGRGIFIFRTLKDFYDWRGKLEVPNSQGQQPSNLTFQQQAYQQYVMTRLQIPSDDFKKENPSVDDKDPAIPDSPINNPDQPDGVQEPDSIPSMDDILSSDATKVENNKNDIYVVQQYITNPYLIGGRKFDIRFFVLVTSFQPLKAWVYREGFARFSQGQFSLESLQDVYIHLTNVAIQRTAEDYNPEMGSKWSILKLRQYLTARHGQELVQGMMNQIDNIVVRTLQSVHQIIIPDRHCFEIYGFDVLIDDCMQPWLLEVNCSPSFTPSNEEDYKLKSALIDDTVNVLDIEGRLTGFEKRVGGYDMIWDDGPVYGIPGDCGHVGGCDDGQKLNSFLGCHNDRTFQLRSIYTNSRFIREICKENSGPNRDITMLGSSPRNIGKSGQYSTEMKDDRFRLPEMQPNRDVPQTTPLVRSSFNFTASRSDTPLIVLGKPVQTRRTVNTIFQRCTADNNKRFPI